MPLLLIAIMTHFIYKAISNGLDWGGEASRRAWAASMAHSRSVADRLRQEMTDRLDSWDQDPRGRRYAATAVRIGMGAGRLLKKVGGGSALMAIKGIGAVSRGLAGGAIATGGLLGALARAGRLSVRDGSEWWRRHHSETGWRWANWVPSLTDRLANRWWQWGNTIPGEAGPDPFDEFDHEDDRPWRWDDEAEESVPDPQSEPERDPQPEPEPEPRTEDRQGGDDDWDPWRSWEREEREPSRAQPRTEKDYGPTTTEWGEEATTVDPTRVGSQAAGTATAVLDPPARPAIEGAQMSTDLLPASGGAVAPISNAADGMQFEQAQAFLAEQERRARELASLAEQIHQLQMKLVQAAAVMGGDHSTAEAALARFGVKAPNVADAIGLLHIVASPAPAEAMVNTYLALDVVANGCDSDAANLQTRFGAAWEATKAEGIDGTFYNG